jgi:thiol:disulfide interchange protein DsbC
MKTRMKSLNSIRLLLAFVAAFSLVPAAAQQTDDNLEQVRQKVSDMFETIDKKDVNVGPVDGWFEIQKGSVVAYISSDGRYLLQGDMIDLDHNVNLSEAARTDARRQIMSTVKDEDVILFSPTDKQYTISVFTDVECTYCRRLHSQIDEYLAHGIEVRYLMYPRNGPTSQAWATAEEVWCSSDRNSALTAAKGDRKFASTNCDASMVQNHYGIGREIGLSGTPAIVFDDGTLISGYVPPDQLKAQLDAAALLP